MTLKVQSMKVVIQSFFSRFVVFQNDIYFVLSFSDYQFAWLTDADTASNIVMSSVLVPFIFILDPSNQQFYLPLENEENWTVESFTAFLDGVLLGNYEV